MCGAETAQFLIKTLFASFFEMIITSKSLHCLSDMYEKEVPYYSEGVLPK